MLLKINTATLNGVLSFLIPFNAQPKPATDNATMLTTRAKEHTGFVNSIIMNIATTIDIMNAKTHILFLIYTSINLVVMI